MNEKKKTISRRGFTIGVTAGIAAFSVVPRHVLAGSGSKAPGDKLNIACIGVGGRGGASLNGVRGENIIALCDVDLRRAASGFKRFPRAKQFRDFRKMFDKIENDVDAVTVATPDHTHAVAAMAAIKRGKHVYCEKPLAHSIYEIRQLMKETHKHKVKTQLGNQGHSFEDIRRCCEWIWDGAIGNVHTVHAACGANHCKKNQFPMRKERPPVPPELNWDLWLGPAKFRHYHPMYLPGSWRGWLPFGSGTIGDWICHVVDPAFWALDLGSPTSVLSKADDYDPVKDADTVPAGSTTRFEFPAKGKRGPVTLYWYSGTSRIPRPEGLEPGKNPPVTGAVILGDKGGIIHGSHGAGGVHLFPSSKMKAYKEPKKTIPRVRGGHHADWLQAIRTGREAGSHFDYGGPLTELARLGIIGFHFLGRKLEWNGAGMKFTNLDEANKYLNPPYRDGWSL